MFRISCHHELRRCPLEEPGCCVRLQYDKPKAFVWGQIGLFQLAVNLVDCRAGRKIADKVAPAP
jgi:hypothetical protein